MTRYVLVILTALIALPSLSSAAPPKKLQWFRSYDGAMVNARKLDKIVLAYFSGSDWDPWTQKLDKEVLSTEMFAQWAQTNVILLQIDFPQGHESSVTKGQNDRLRLKYSVSKVPTFVFLDPSGLPIARAGYDDVRLLDQEPKGQPKTAIAFLDNIIKHRPKDESIKGQPDFITAMTYAKAHYALMLLVITQGELPAIAAQRDALLKDQEFVRFVNRNLVFVQLQWPEASDVSKEAEAFRAFLTREKIEPTPLQLIVYDAPLKKLKSRITGFSLDHVDQLINTIQAQLPKIDYTSGWIDDFNTARTIAAQQDRYIFLAFTSMDSGEWSKKMDDEIFQTDAFKKYARKHLVLVSVDFPTATTQPQALAAQNKMLADMYNVRGFPTVVVINPLGQKLAISKYMRGGPSVFLSELDPLIEQDTARRAALKD